MGAQLYSGGVNSEASSFLSVFQFSLVAKRDCAIRTGDICLV